MARRSFRLKLLVCAAALLILLFLTRFWWLSALGQALIHDEGPGKADIAVVLAGDLYGHRVLRAAELIRQGYVPSALVSGPVELYGHPESEYAIAYAAQMGYPAAAFISFPHSALSTRTEARVVMEELKRRNIKSFLLVTSDYHTARAGRIFRAQETAMGGGPEIRVVAAPDESFRADSWWRQREAQKITFMEWLKTIATALGH